MRGCPLQLGLVRDHLTFVVTRAGGRRERRQASPAAGDAGGRAHGDVHHQSAARAKVLASDRAYVVHQCFVT